MLFIHSLLSPDLVLIHPETKNKASLIKLMIDKLEAGGKTNNGELLFQDVLKREELSTTALDCECAVPHAHSTAMESTTIAAALLDEGVDFNSQDGKKAKLVFLITGPKNHSGLHLKLLSKMARILQDRDFREILMNADSGEEFQKLIKKREV
jgi:fructose-specific phosphotransferase system IIA component